MWSEAGVELILAATRVSLLICIVHGKERVITVWDCSISLTLCHKQHKCKPSTCKRKTWI